MVHGNGKIGVVFDCDGTLLDSMEMWHSLDDRIAEAAGVVFTPEDKDFFTSGTLAECGEFMHVKYGIGESGTHVERMISDEIMRWYEESAVARPGVMSFVGGLASAGIPMSVASSTPAEYLREGLKNAGLLDYMSAVVSVEDVNSSKREPKVYDVAREAMGTARENTWGFEDAVYALNTLRKAGYKTVGVYDSDIAGTPECLAEASDLFIRTFEDLTAEKFIEIAKGTE